MFKFQRATTNSFVRSFERKLHVFIEPKPEIVIANNSGIFFTLASLREHGLHMHPDLTFIKQDFWLDHVHEDFKNLDWGQTPLGLPWFVREEFFKINPTHKQQDYITWKQFQELRAFCIDELKKINVKFYSGLPNIQKHLAGYTVSTDQGSFQVSENCHFYNSFKIPDTNHEYQGLTKISHTTLYNVSKEEVPKNVILLGGGRSAYWAAIHHPETLFVCISKELTLPLLEGEVHPANMVMYSSSDFNHPSSKFLLRKSLEDDKKATIFTKKPELVPIFEGNFLCAIGLMQRKDITQQVKSEHLTLHPFKKIIGNWASAQELPIGSLIESTVRWAIATKNYNFAYEPHCFYPNHFIELMIGKMEKKGIKLPYTFFDYLVEDITSRKTVPSQDEILAAYEHGFIKAYEGNVPNTTVKRFITALRDIEFERVEDYKDKTIIANKQANLNSKR